MTVDLFFSKATYDNKRMNTASPKPADNATVAAAKKKTNTVTSNSVSKINNKVTSKNGKVDAVKMESISLDPTVRGDNNKGTAKFKDKCNAQELPCS